MEKFLEAHNIPEHLKNLLELCGVCSIADLVDLTEDDLADFEKTIREGGFKDQIDMESRKVRMKYFGIDGWEDCS